MSDKRQYPYAKALEVAHDLQGNLSGACESERCVIAGSIRRMKNTVSDIELLYVPRIETMPDGLFDFQNISLVERLLDSWLDAGLIAKRQNVNGSYTWGPKNKLAIHVPSGIPVDFFGTEEDAWYVSLVIRTGPKHSNLALTMGANRQGASLLAYGTGVRWGDGTITAATSERHVFEMCGVPYKDAQDR